MIDIANSSGPAGSKSGAALATGLGFGRVFTDHMLLARYETLSGWQDARIVPYGPLSLDPATMALHYGQSVFEGIKAFRGDDGRVRIFRPQKYIARLNSSARRLCIPALDEDIVLHWLLDLVRRDEASVPCEPGSALYLRPFIFASDPFIGVRPSASYVFCVIASPVGAYYGDEGPLKILAEDHYVRTVEGGVGAAKTGGNYAASLLAAEAAHASGYTQVLWLDAIEHRYLEEVGTMNVILRLGDEIVTPPLGGSTLDGVTRDSALTLLKDWGIPAAERRISIDEVVAAADDGLLHEMWGTGTAAGIAPIGVLGYKGSDYPINEGLPGEISGRLQDALDGIQYGRSPDPRRWMVAA